MAKAFDPRAKAKRQKIIAGVLGLVLVGVLIFQAPTILSMFGGGSSAASEPAATTPTPAPAAPTPVTPGTPAPATPAPGAPAGGAALVDSDPAPTPTDGQLVSFDRFESKDPFVQQLEDAPAGQTAAPSAPADAGSKADDPEAGGSGEAPAPQPAAPAAKTTARISVNGTAHEVSAGGSFPAEDPIFRLVSLRNGTAKVGIVGGSYANGAPTITLKKGGKPVTLMNTAEGTTYVLRFLR
ncbi:MAG TPA: hypothetical protein VF236_10310 [Gaiellaceae bacterium]